MLGTSEWLDVEFSSVLKGDVKPFCLRFALISKRWNRTSFSFCKFAKKSFVEYQFFSAQLLMFFQYIYLRLTTVSVHLARLFTHTTIASVDQDGRRDG